MRISDWSSDVCSSDLQAFDVAHGQGRADADSLRDVVDAVTEQVEATHAQAPLFERYAELDHQLADIAGDGFGRADRLGKAAANLDQILGPDRIDEFGREDQRLVEPEIG